MKKRGRPDIIAEVLEAANGGVGKTRLLIKANLTSIQLKKYVNLMLEKDLIALCENRRNGHPMYKTTGLGLQYLSLYNSIRSVAFINA